MGNLQKLQVREVLAIVASVSREKTAGVDERVSADEEVGHKVLARGELTATALAANRVTSRTSRAFDAAGAPRCVLSPATAGEGQRFGACPDEADIEVRQERGCLIRAAEIAGYLGQNDFTDDGRPVFFDPLER
jgi:hypothetical protein